LIICLTSDVAAKLLPRNARKTPPYVDVYAASASARDGVTRHSGDVQARRRADGVLKMTRGAVTALSVQVSAVGRREQQ